MKKATVISAFPGTGKSWVFNNSDQNVLDSDSSQFDKAHFPANYIQHIKDNLYKADVIFVSSHDVVRDALVEADIDFFLVYPREELKEEYLERYKERGSPGGFINLLDCQWEVWIKELIEFDGCRGKFVLQSGQHIADLDLVENI